MMFRELLAADFSPYGTLSPTQLDRLENHYELLTRWNQRLNLTRIRSLEEAARFHYCESLFLGQALPLGSFCVGDVGSGAGFPGIPVAILRPELRVDLFESHQRKAVFLREATRSLTNVRVLARRAQDCQNEYDWMIGRAIRVDTLLTLRLARRFAFLMGARDATKISGARIERVPWGRHRVLVCSTWNNV